MSEPLTLVFAMPPSTNNLFANSRTGGRHKTKTYRAWIAEAGWQILTQPRRSFAGEVSIEIKVGPRQPNADCSNKIKAVEDLLVSHEIIRDDRYVKRVSAEWSEDVKGCQVTITDAGAV